MFNIFEEISWPEYAKLPNVARLPLNEQVTAYNQYLFQLSEARMNWITYQNKGPRGIINVGLLAQEEFDTASDDYFLVLQEDGYGIFVTQFVE